VAVAPSALTDALHDRFTFERELGRGGMGLVWLARDLRHNRQVAVKVIRPELASVLGAERFAREIQLAAQLQHPNIVPVYESGECQGTLYYVMPYVEGESLRAQLRREAQLPLDDALRIAREVADALAYAHAHGVVHRDIKPENILLAGGHALVVDFGIARAITAAGTDRLTETGLVIGTPAYMSPEQSSGSPALDGRSDLYSLACVVYEMLAGEPPYTGPSSQAIIAKRLTEPVPHLRTVREGIPEGVEQAITRALAKVPADRYLTARAFSAALERTIGAPSARTTRVARIARVPRRIWILTALTLGAAAVTVAATAALRLRQPLVYTAGRVAVAPIENQTGDSAVAHFTRQLLTALPDAVAREGVGDPVPAATVRDVLARARGSPGEVADRLARETSAGLELRGVCTQAGAAGTACQMDVLRMPAKALRMSVSVTGDPAQLAFGAELTERVLVALLLQRTYGDQVTWQGEYIPRSLAAVRAMASELDRPWKQGSGVAEAARLDTAWVGAAAFATEHDSSDAAAESTLVRLLRRPGLSTGEHETVAYELAGRRADPELAFTLAQRRFAINPVWWRNRLLGYALMTSRPHVALTASAEPDSASAPAGTGPDAQSYHLRGYALHQLGRYREQLQLARLIEQRFPATVQVYRTQELMALAALGEVDSLRRRLVEWEATPEKSGWAGTRAFIAGQELMAHGHEREGREVVASTLPFYRRLRETEGPNYAEVQALEWTGQLEEARRLAQAVLPSTKSPVDSLVYLGELGAIAAQQGSRAEAARYDRLLAAEHRPDPDLLGFVAFLRASIASRLGDREGAVRLLHKARAAGNASAAHSGVHRDPAFASLHDYAPFQRLLEPRD
jgi:tetratricopeptide (TPR) repeat protein